MNKYRVVVDSTGCCGHGRCYDLSPELFESDVEGHSTVVHEVVDDDLLPGAERAAAACPERAITVTPI
jgi:ferredoxin